MVHEKFGRLIEEWNTLDNEINDMLTLINSELTDRRRAGASLSFSPNLIRAALRYVMGIDDDDIMLEVVSIQFKSVDRWFEDDETATLAVVCYVAEMSRLVNTERLKALKAIVLIGKPIHDRLFSYATSAYTGDEYDRRMLAETVIYLTVQDALFDRFTSGLIRAQSNVRAFHNWYEAENLASFIEMATNDHPDSIIEQKVTNLRLMAESHGRFVSSS